VTGPAALAAELGVVLDEAALPIRPEVNGACEILGIDPLYVANEGKLVAVVGPDGVDAALAALRAHPLGREAAVIGEVAAQPPGMVLLADVSLTHRISERGSPRLGEITRWERS